jgi:hypothetical protein
MIKTTDVTVTTVDPTKPVTDLAMKKIIGVLQQIL